MPSDRTTSSCRSIARLAALLVTAVAARAGAQTPVIGLHAGGPIRASAVVGVWVGENPRHDDASGALLLVEPGLRGGRVSIGYAYALRGGFGSFVTARATALRTWRAVGGPRDYAGAEVQVLPILAVGPRLGAFVPIDHGPRPRRVLWMLDVGLGL
jgi:hypothetical protein